MFQYPQHLGHNPQVIIVIIIIVHIPESCYVNTVVIEVFQIECFHILNIIISRRKRDIERGSEREIKWRLN